MVEFDFKDSDKGRPVMEKIVLAIEFAKKHELFQRLQEVYATIPEGKCGGCAACCMESVETHWVEFLQIYDYLQQRPEILKLVLPEIIQFYLLEGVERRYCPFLLTGRKCAIYLVRPLPCRLFGQWGLKDYEANFEVTRRNNRKTADYYRQVYGLELPETVVNPQLPYCTTFKKAKNLTMDDFYDLLDEMMVIQSRFLLAEELIDEEYMQQGLVSWLMGTLVDSDNLQPQKIEIMREYLQDGKTEKLQVLLNSIVKKVVD